MKKIALTICVALSACFSVSGQNFSEFFKQNKTQKKYLLQQIAALQVYIEAARKGYQVMNRGLSLWGDLKSGDFNLHSIFFNSLKLVNSRIRNYQHVADIITLQYQISQQRKKIMELHDQGQFFSTEESTYISEVISRVMTDCGQQFDDLLDVVTDGQTEMDDEERLRRIDLIYSAMLSNWRFIQYFGTAVMEVGMSAKQETDEINRIKDWYNIK